MPDSVANARRSNGLRPSARGLLRAIATGHFLLSPLSSWPSGTRSTLNRERTRADLEAPGVISGYFPHCIYEASSRSCPFASCITSRRQFTFCAFRKPGGVPAPHWDCGQRDQCCCSDDSTDARPAAPPSRTMIGRAAHQRSSIQLPQPKLPGVSNMIVSLSSVTQKVPVEGEKELRLIRFPSVT